MCLAATMYTLKPLSVASDCNRHVIGVVTLPSSAAEGFVFDSQVDLKT